MAKAKQANKRKPNEKALRSDLEEKRSEMESKGWQISQMENDLWRAEKKFEGEPFTTKLENSISIQQLLNAVEEFESRYDPKSETIDEIELTRIAPSRFPTQARRRERFKNPDIESLGESIKKHGLRQPILIRPVAILDELKADFEIVFGERRFLAVQKNGDKKIKCFIENLTDAQVLELQYEENHRRQESHPLDDAFLFKFLIENEGYDVSRLADRFATSAKDITNRLKLNDLTPAAIEELLDESLPLRHAYFLAKFPAETQKIIVEEQYAYKYGDKDEGPCSYQEFKEEVEENIIRNLSKAPFDPEDERLHLKGLKCSNCSERTGYAPLLFGNLAKDDSCLNKSCFEFKSNVHLRLQREAIAQTAENKPIEKAVKDVPLVTERSWSDAKENPFNEKPLTGQKLLEKPECEFSVLSLAVDGDKKGQQVYVCRNKECPTHNPKKSEDELTDYQRENLENEFSVKVGLAVRAEIFEEAIKFFGKGNSNSFWQYAELVEKLLADLLFIRRTYLIPFKNVLKKFPKCPSNFEDSTKNLEFVAGLEPFQQSQLLFLCTLATVGHMSWRLEPQDGVKKLAEDYCPTILDWDLLDAEKRLDLAPDEFKDQAAAHLEKIKSGEKSEVPAFWLSKKEI